MAVLLWGVRASPTCKLKECLTERNWGILACSVVPLIQLFTVSPLMQRPNRSAHMDTQQQVAAARLLLRAGGLQR